MLLIVTLVCLGCLSAAAQAAAPPPLLWQIPSDGKPVEEAGQIGSAYSIASDDSSGHVYVADHVNSRISEFDAWGVFVKAWGWGVRDGSSEAQVCTMQTGCLEGIAGSNPGQLGSPFGIAVDGAGDIYVYEAANQRVTKFAPDGSFLLMFGGEVDKTTKANVCTAASGDECGGGVPGSGPGEFSIAGDRQAFSNIAVSPAGTVWVGDIDRIEQFEADGTFKSEMPAPEPGLVGPLAIDPQSEDLYLAFAQSPTSTTPEVFRLKQGNGELVGKLAVGRPSAIATDSVGNVWVVDDPEPFGFPEVEPFIREFDATGKELIGVDAAFDRPSDGSGLSALATSSGCNVPGDALYVSHGLSASSYLRAFGPHPDPTVCAPPKVPPSIEAEYAASVGSDNALLRAVINPHFFADTTYYVEYGAAACSAGGCEKRPLSPANLTDKVVDAPLTSGGILLSGLSPGSEYHYRFVSQGSGGGPTFGEDRIFNTFPLSATAKVDCPNQALRPGASAHLPDCRAYEMVSPIDKNGGDISVLPNAHNYPAGLDQSSSDGDKLAYSSQVAFGDAVSAPYTSQYLASREAGAGWFTHSISPPRLSKSVTSFSIPRLDLQYKAFSGDLCQGWLQQDTEPPLAPGGVPGYLNLYRRANCGSTSYEAITDAEPVATNPEAYWPELQGTSADGSHTVFRANGKLTEDASSATSGGEPIYQIYDHFEGKLHLVSVLPNGKASSTPASVGTASAALPENRSNNVARAVSADGSRIFWTARQEVPGPLYVRIDGQETRTLSTSPARFLAASPDGSKAIFTKNEKINVSDLFEFDVEAGEASLIAHEVFGLLGASEDASRLYFLSSEELKGEGEAGKPNLYFYEAGTGSTYVATLSALDTTTTYGRISSPVNPEPVRHSARVSPDGRSVAFVSTASPTGYDNLDVVSGKADAEVYLYDAEADRLSCVSCNPSGARSEGRDVIGSTIEYWAAAQIPGWANQHYASRALSEDGSRLFFESFGGLVPRDNNGAQDVYEWEAADSAGACEELGAELYVASSAGCLSLISSGESPLDSSFIDASPDGRDVFFKTSSSLLPQDSGLADIYDARVNGGFLPRPDAAAACEGEACQGAPSPPNDPTPASAAFRGAGSVKAAAGKRKHHKARKHRKRQQKKHRHATHRRTNR